MRIMSQRPHNISPDDYIKNLVANLLGPIRSPPLKPSLPPPSFAPSPVHRNTPTPTDVTAFTSSNNTRRKTAKHVDPQKTSGSEAPRPQAGSSSSPSLPTQSPGTEAATHPGSSSSPSLPTHSLGTEAATPPCSSLSPSLPTHSLGTEAATPPGSSSSPSLLTQSLGTEAATPPGSSSSPSLPTQSLGTEATTPPGSLSSLNPSTQFSGTEAVRPEADSSSLPSLPLQSSLLDPLAEENAILGILGTINSWLEAKLKAFDATRDGDTVSGLTMHLVKKYHATCFFALLIFVFRLSQRWNLKLEEYVNYGRRLTRKLLYTIFTLHPLLTKVYPIIESALLSLHITTLFVACTLYAQEAFVLATQMDPRFTIA